MPAIQSETSYEIGEFAEIVGLSAPTIRYYENQGLLKARRTDNGRRYFTEQDIKWVKFLLHLKGTGMSINDLKKYVTWRAEGDQTIPDRLDLLKKTKADFMEEYRQVQHHLQILNDKIDWYEAKESGKDTGKEPFATYLQRLGHHE
ncbi:MerR family transcriptional regulator [Lentilactobacillus buchneri]|uniref:Transcriptional regulator, MerR family n=2 Tax=Lentilactobacillus buchneri TaxID=1581 RepID=J9W9S0_LENBU|nr:MerR family transcriptional regulator [Lentilactobacillus buchneri]WCJ52302.1 MerR family transcriptional regulator [Lentilactobacillus sp. Egmn17]AEB74029.1 transcriptional regulator, MerR family [Lentilactobacillus buchneri NRRL B-30929]AFS00856.1 transcriptional regulator, MerR family [Lentilactobacillus buchneri subsp. silagei CD034]KRK68866.1 MerR family transcriptional regulator [Lentilactobacillus buchneri DSM 20057]MCT2898912.1 MerR family transcriptional regulator [Lentilactobacill